MSTFLSASVTHHNWHQNDLVDEKKDAKHWARRQTLIICVGGRYMLADWASCSQTKENNFLSQTRATIIIISNNSDRK